MKNIGFKRSNLSLENSSTVNKTTLTFRKVRPTFERSFDDTSEAFVADDLVEPITNGRKSDVAVDIRSHFRLHLST